jgi:hypothetical protein
LTLSLPPLSALFFKHGGVR